MDRGTSPGTVETPSPSTSQTDDITILMASLDWARDTIRKIMNYGGDSYVKSNLMAIANAIDPALNPRIKPIYERRRLDGT